MSFSPVQNDSIIFCKLLLFSLQKTGLTREVVRVHPCPYLIGEHKKVSGVIVKPVVFIIFLLTQTEKKAHKDMRFSSLKEKFLCHQFG